MVYNRMRLICALGIKRLASAVNRFLVVLSLKCDLKVALTNWNVYLSELSLCSSHAGTSLSARRFQTCAVEIDERKPSSVLEQPY